MAICWSTAVELSPDASGKDIHKNNCQCEVEISVRVKMEVCKHSSNSRTRQKPSQTTNNTSPKNSVHHERDHVRPTPQAAVPKTRRPPGLLQYIYCQAICTHQKPIKTNIIRHKNAGAIANHLECQQKYGQAQPANRWKEPPTIFAWLSSRHKQQAMGEHRHAGKQIGRTNDILLSLLLLLLLLARAANLQPEKEPPQRSTNTSNPPSTQP